MTTNVTSLIQLKFSYAMQKTKKEKNNQADLEKCRKIKELEDPHNSKSRKGSKDKK